MTQINDFLQAKSFAVAGATNHRQKFGNLVFRALLTHGKQVFPINLTSLEIEGHKAYATVLELPLVPEALSIVTPPNATRRIVADAITAGVKHIWMQPGAMDDQASRNARAAGINVIDDGSCLLVELDKNHPE